MATTTGLVRVRPSMPQGSTPVAGQSGCPAETCGEVLAMGEDHRAPERRIVLVTGVRVPQRGQHGGGERVELLRAIESDEQHVAAGLGGDGGRRVGFWCVWDC